MAKSFGLDAELGSRCDYSLLSQNEHNNQAKSVPPRSSRSCYVTNEAPAFSRPQHHKSRPQFIGKSHNIASKRDVSCWAGWTVLRPAIGRSRCFNKHRAAALNAITPAMIHYINVVTWQVETSVDVLTRQCGLDTLSVAGNHSISRGSRLIQELEKMGIVECTMHWDPVAGCWAYKSITVTERFWDMVGVGAEEAINARDLAWERWRTTDAWMRDGLSAEIVGNMSRTRYSELRRQRLAQRAYEYRHKKAATAVQIRRAKRLVAAGKDAMRREVSTALFAKMTPEEARKAMQDPAGFNRTVTLAMANLEALAMEPLPPPDK